MNVLEIVENKLIELMNKVDGIELKSHGKRTIINLSNTITHIHQLNDAWDGVSPTFTPLFAFNEESQAMWAALWAGIYLEMKEVHKIPGEALHCMKLSTEWMDTDDMESQPVDVPLQGPLFTEEQRFFVRCSGLAPPLVDDRIRETYHVFTRYGVNADWWSHDLVEGLPHREQRVLDFIASRKERAYAESILDMMEEE